MPDDAFYIGYAPKMPPLLGRSLRFAVSLGVCVAVAVAVLLALNQSPFDEAVFEYGNTREYAGTIYSAPVPHIITGAGEAPYWLVDRGKHAFNASSWTGMSVHLRGFLIHRGNDRMIEVHRVGRSAAPAVQPLSETAPYATELRGEIVDSKCYLGVMNPGRGKVHRDCAVRCLSGGIPPGLRLRGSESIILLTGLGREALRYAGQPVVVSGDMTSVGGKQVLRVAVVQPE